MNTRRSRFSLSLVRQSESPMSPIGDRTRSSISELDITASSGCSTPLNTRKRSCSYKSDSPVFNNNDQSPIPMSQDASNVVTGVSWAWNSPKRAVVPDYKLRSRPLTNRNVISNKDPDFSRSNRKKITRKLTGFQRFQTELKLLQDRDEPVETVKTPSSSSIQVEPPTSPPPSPDNHNVFVTGQRTVTKPDTPSAKKTSFFKRHPTTSVASDSFNDSELDNLLLQASQAVETEATVPTALGNQTKLTTVKHPEKRRSFFKSKTTDNFDGNSDESLADAELELLLAQIDPQIGKSVETTSESKQNNNVTTDKRNSKPKGLLTRHKSMPESPSRKVIESTNSRTSNTEQSENKFPQSPVTVSSTSSGSIRFVPTKTEVVLVPSSNGSSTTSNPSSTELQPARVCSKEEIEQKRQEALKRQACRLKRLMQGNHSQGDVKFIKSRK